MDVSAWQILLIEDDEVQAQQYSGILARRPVGQEGQMANVEIADGFASGMQKLLTTKYDLVVLDIRDESGEAHEPEEAAGDETTAADIGIRLYREIRSRRAVPVIFHSAVAHLVQDQANPPFVTVVSKLDEDDQALRKAVMSAIDSRLPALNRALNQFAEGVLRVYLQDFVERHWNQLHEPGREPDLAHLLARRLAVSLGDGTGLARELSSVPGPDPAPSTGLAHPMRMYVVPPIGDWTTGDILHGPDLLPEDGVSSSAPCGGSAETDDGDDRPSQDPADSATAIGDTGQSAALKAAGDAAPTTAVLTPGYWVMLTPACDLVEGRVKADYVVLAGCQPLSAEDETKDWTADDSSTKRGKLNALLTNNRKSGQPDRFHALLPAWDIPGLLVDFQRITYVPYTDLRLFARVATLDDPYAQELTARFGRYIGRLGTPDIDLGIVRSRLKNAVEQ